MESNDTQSDTKAWKQSLFCQTSVTPGLPQHNNKTSMSLKKWIDFWAPGVNVWIFAPALFWERIYSVRGYYMGSVS